MVNNLGIIMQKFIKFKKNWWVINCRIFGTENRNFQHYITYAILPINIWCHNDVVVNKNYGTIEDKISKHWDMRKAVGQGNLLLSFLKNTWTLSGLSLSHTSSVQQRQGSGTKHTVCTTENTELVQELVLSQESQFATHWPVDEIIRETVI